MNVVRNNSTASQEVSSGAQINNALLLQPGKASRTTDMSVGAEVDQSSGAK